MPSVNVNVQCRTNEGDIPLQQEEGSAVIAEGMRLPRPTPPVTSRSCESLVERQLTPLTYKMKDKEDANEDRAAQREVKMPVISRKLDRQRHANNPVPVHSLEGSTVTVIAEAPDEVSQDAPSAAAAPTATIEGSPRVGYLPPWCSMTSPRTSWSPVRSRVQDIAEPCHSWTPVAQHMVGGKLMSSMPALAMAMSPILGAQDSLRPSRLCPRASPAIQLRQQLATQLISSPTMLRAPLSSRSPVVDNVLEDLLINMRSPSAAHVTAPAQPGRTPVDSGTPKKTIPVPVVRLDWASPTNALRPLRSYISTIPSSSRLRPHSNEDRSLRIQAGSRCEIPKVDVPSLCADKTDFPGSGNADDKTDSVSNRILCGTFQSDTTLEPEADTCDRCSLGDTTKTILDPNAVMTELAQKGGLVSSNQPLRPVTAKAATPGMPDEKTTVLSEPCLSLTQTMPHAGNEVKSADVKLAPTSAGTNPSGLHGAILHSRSKSARPSRGRSRSNDSTPNVRRILSCNLAVRADKATALATSKLESSQLLKPIPDFAFKAACAENELRLKEPMPTFPRSARCDNPVRGKITGPVTVQPASARRTVGEARPLCRSQPVAAPISNQTPMVDQQFRPRIGKETPVVSQRSSQHTFGPPVPKAFPYSRCGGILTSPSASRRTIQPRTPMGVSTVASSAMGMPWHSPPQLSRATIHGSPRAGASLIFGSPNGKTSGPSAFDAAAPVPFWLSAAADTASPPRAPIATFAVGGRATSRSPSPVQLGNVVRPRIPHSSPRFPFPPNRPPQGKSQTGIEQVWVDCSIRTARI